MLQGHIKACRLILDALKLRKYLSLVCKHHFGCFELLLLEVAPFDDLLKDVSVLGIFNEWLCHLCLPLAQHV